MNSKVCLINAFWLGERRYQGVKEYKTDKLFFVKKQIECLQTYKHNLTKIIFVFNIEPNHYRYLSKIFSITPKQIQGAEIEIIVRENKGISYGAWSDSFEKYKSEYDYYIFNEDDYFFVQHDWDSYLVTKHNSYKDCGYLCMAIREPQSWNKFKKHAGISIGIASSENLMKVFSKYGALPNSGHILQKDFNTEGWEKGIYTGTGEAQVNFTFAYIQFGLNIYDIRDDYATLFQKDAPHDPEINYWIFNSWNKQFLSVSSVYFTGSYKYWVSHDSEFVKNYVPTSFEQAYDLYKNKKDFHTIIGK